MIIGVGVKKKVSVNYTLTKNPDEEESQSACKSENFGDRAGQTGLVGNKIENKPEKFKSNLNQGDFGQPKTRVHIIGRSHHYPAVALFLKN